MFSCFHDKRSANNTGTSVHVHIHVHVHVALENVIGVMSVSSPWQTRAIRKFLRQH